MEVKPFDVGAILEDQLVRGLD